MAENTPKQPSRQTAPRASDEAMTFLKTLDGVGLITLWAKKPDGYSEGRTFRSDQHAAMADWIEARLASMNLYFMLNEVAPSAPTDERLGKEHVVALRGV